MKIYTNPEEALQIAIQTAHRKEEQRIIKQIKEAQQLALNYKVDEPNLQPEEWVILRHWHRNRLSGTEIGIYQTGIVVTDEGSIPDILRINPGKPEEVKTINQRRNEPTNRKTNYQEYQHANDKLVKQLITQPAAIGLQNEAIWADVAGQVQFEIELENAPIDLAKEKRGLGSGPRQLENIPLWKKHREEIHNRPTLDLIKKEGNGWFSNDKYPLLNAATREWLNSKPWRTNPDWKKTTTKQAWLALNFDKICELKHQINRTVTYPFTFKPENIYGEKASLLDHLARTWEPRTTNRLAELIIKCGLGAESLQTALASVIQTLLQPCNHIDTEKWEQNQHSEINQELWLLQHDEFFNLTYGELAQNANIHKVCREYSITNYKANNPSDTWTPSYCKGNSDQIMAGILDGTIAGGSPFSEMLAEML